MANSSHPLDVHYAAAARRSVSGRHLPLEQIMAAQPKNESSVASDTAWSSKLKTCVETATRELNCEVLSAKPVRAFTGEDENDMQFELSTSRGLVKAMRTKTGRFVFMTT